jgi:hypothetical protein
VLSEVVKQIRLQERETRAGEISRHPVQQAMALYRLILMGVDYAADRTPHAVAVGDFNRDGIRR